MLVFISNHIFSDVESTYTANFVYLYLHNFPIQPPQIYENDDDDIQNVRQTRYKIYRLDMAIEL